MAARIARGVEAVMADEAKPGARRSSDYLVFEALLEKAAGPDASRLHTGRSRQDIGATSARIAWRDALLATYDASIAPRGQLLDLASRHIDTVLPAYTPGLHAPPLTPAHHLPTF